MTELSASILAARQLAGLRRAGWNMLEALDFVIPSLPTGATRQGCEAAAARLRSGADGSTALPQVGSLSARGELASPEAFEALAESMEARQSSAVASRTVFQLVSFFFAGPLVLGTFAGWAIPDGLLGTELPDATQFVIGFLHVLKFVGLPLAVGAVFLTRWLLARISPGRRELDASAALFEVAAGLSDIADLRRLLSAAEEDYFRWRRTVVEDQRTAALELARELLRSGRARLRTFQAIAPILSAIAFAWLVFNFAFPLALPIFHLAGSVK